MSTTAADLKSYVAAPDADDDLVDRCYAEATALLAQFIGDATVPDEVLDSETLEVGSRLYHRRAAPNGVSQFLTPDGGAVRIARDPLEPSYPVLRRYVGLGIG